jgi:acyl transferase domain-containing protein
MSGSSSYAGSGSRIIALSAHTPRALAEVRERLAAAWCESPQWRLDDVATTLATGREHMPERWAAVVADRDTAVAALRGRRGALDPIVAGRADLENPPPVIFTFPGWEVRPGRVSPLFAETHRWLDRAAALLDAEMTVPLSRWWELPDDDPAADDPAVAEPAAFAAGYGLARQYQAWNVVPVAAAGQGAREFIANAVLGVMSFDDALLRVANWGRMLSEGTVEPDTDDDFLDRVAALVKKDALVLEIGAQTPRDVLSALARLWCQGVPVDLTTGRSGRRLHLPAYPFQRHGDRAPEIRPDLVGRPLTALEQRLIFLDLVRRSGNQEHTVAVAGVVEEVLDVAALRLVFAEVQQEHPELRTMFTRRDDRWVAVTRPEPVRLLIGEAGSDPLHELRSHPFAPSDGPLLRGLLTTDAGERHVIGLAAHQALADGARLSALLTEMSERYVQRTGGRISHHLPEGTR